MIRFKTGDILTENVEALVNTVNCVGIMGRGIALQFKKAFPDNFNAYAKACKSGKVRPGIPFVFETHSPTNPRYIINFPTKRHWRGNSRIEDIEDGLAALVELIREREIRSIALPPLGSGLGGLKWSDVRQRIEKALCDFDDLLVVVFEPNAELETSRTVPNRKAPDMTPGRAALVGLMQRYLNGMLDPFVTLLEVHKLMYFMQAAGEPLRLKYAEGPYGPYAENLRHVLKEVEGYFISGYGDGGEDPSKPLELIPRAVENAESFLARSHETRNRFDRVANLIKGFESPFGLELLSTVHWVINHKAASSLDDVIARTHGWNARKKRFSHRQIQLATEVLARKDWTDGFTADTQVRNLQYKSLESKLVTELNS